MNPTSLVQRPVIIQEGNFLQASGNNTNENLTKLVLNSPQNESTLNILQKKVIYLEEENIYFFKTIEKLMDSNNYLENLIKENPEIDDSKVKDKNNLILQLKFKQRLHNEH